MTCTASRHAQLACAERRIPWSIVETVLSAPEQIVEAERAKRIYQSQVQMDGETFLIRVVVGFSTSPPTIVTVYRTRKIGKYWSTR